MRLRLACGHAVLVSALALAVATSSPASADSVAEFYQGNTVRVIVPAGLGGSIGLYGKLFADHVGRNIPGRPTVVVQSMPGGGGVRAAGWAYNAGPKDGSVISQILSPSLGAPALRGAQFDPARFYWLGTISPRTSVIGVWHTVPVRTIEDAKRIETVLASGGRGNSTFIVPVLLNEMIGTRFKPVPGYPDGGTMNLAMESGEVHGRYTFWTGWVTGKPDWIRDSKVRVLAQAGPKLPELPDAPSVLDLVEDPEHRQMLRFMELSEQVGLGFWVPQEVPEDRRTALRTAFMATMKDPAFLADAERGGAPIVPVEGEKIAAIVESSLDIPPAVIDRLKAMVGFE